MSNTRSSAAFEGDRQPMRRENRRDRTFPPLALHGKRHWPCHLFSLSALKAGQSHLAILLPFSPLSFPRKRESSAPKPVTRPWIPACAGMTATERSENPNACPAPEGRRGRKKQNSRQLSRDVSMP